MSGEIFGKKAHFPLKSWKMRGSHPIRGMSVLKAAPREKVRREKRRSSFRKAGGEMAKMGINTQKSPKRAPSSQGDGQMGLSNARRSQ